MGYPQRVVDRLIHPQGGEPAGCSPLAGGLACVGMKPDITARLKDLTRPTGTEDLLDVDYPAPRFTVSLRHAAVVAGVAVVGVGGWFVLREDPHDPVTVTALAQSSIQQTSSEQDIGIVVSVLGHVDKPGLVTLAPNARVADALAAAGALPDAELTTLNLAQVLEDGVQIVVVPQGPAPPESLPPPPGAGGTGITGGVDAGGLVSLNNATVDELVTLPGVGEKTAQAILQYRDTSGGFTSVDDLLNVKGIGPSKFAQLSESVRL